MFKLKTLLVIFIENVRFSGAFPGLPGQKKSRTGHLYKRRESGKGYTLLFGIYVLPKYNLLENFVLKFYNHALTIFLHGFGSCPFFRISTLQMFVLSFSWYLLKITLGPPTLLSFIV